ncbi:MAG: threonine aldolase, partial [Gammaproteobacteria bacterium]
CARGEEVILGDNYHIFIDEAGGVSALGGVVMQPLQTDARGSFSLEQLQDAIKPDDFHCPISKLLSLENTVSGKLQDLNHVKALTGLARQHGLHTHLDGARIMNASIASGQTAAALAADFDSVMLCLSKGLGCPVGAMLCGSVEFIGKARRLRKMLGGGMRQAGILAACGIYALDNNVDRLREDHANALRLAEGIAGIDSLAVEQDTNMVFITPQQSDVEALRETLAQQGINIGDQSRSIRLVTHLDVSAADIDRVISSVRGYYQR